MHQAQRLVSIHDDLPRIRPQRESLQLIFLITCSEHIAKLHAGFTDEGKSRAYVQEFFDKFVSDADQDALKSGFSHYNRRPMELKEIVDLLYGVRCDVVHEGKYWNFSFHDGSTAMLNGDPDVIVSLQFPEFPEHRRPRLHQSHRKFTVKALTI